MSDYIERMAKEAEELEGKLQKLNSALMFEGIAEISIEQRGLMAAQSKAMRCYLQILEARLYLARGEGEEKTT